MSPSTGTSLVCLALLILTSGFAEAALPPTDDLQIVTDPPGAAVVVKPDGIHCTSPCRVTLGRLLAYVIEVSSPGYITQTVQVKAGSDQFRAEHFLRPNPVEVKLESSPPLSTPADPPQPSMRPPLPEPTASLDNCIQPAAVDRETCLGRIKLQMPLDIVEAVLGHPDGVSRDETTLRYGDRYLKFGEDGRLMKISDQPL